MDYIAMFICKYLEFNMPGIFNIFFNITCTISKSAFCFRLCCVKTLYQGGIIMCYAHTASTTSRTS